ncbi:DUF6146 family protein [Aegicerativicinus sediminis]|uniref:DUF6146 family protein n=1 Tax=Aegicerativicinus sediminis TaxID=2893202 RepID=UPI001E4D681C|nr:DUF6146 family protein [Aegicerativicinus sediminis]
MKILKYLLTIAVIGTLLFTCKTNKSTTDSNRSVNIKEGDTVRIANDSIEYEIIIIEPGFNTWLISRARPEGYYSQQFLENRNLIYVQEWNYRVMQPQLYNPNLYEMQIDYRPGIDYGYEVNYKLYNYFIYFQLTYKQRLAGFVPRI